MNFIFVAIRMVISIAGTRKTEPRYEIRFAHNAWLKVVEHDKRRYPTFVTEIEAKSKTIHLLTSFGKRVYPKRIKTENNAAMPYIIVVSAVFSPVLAQPKRQNEQNKNTNKKDKVFFIKIFENKRKIAKLHF